MKLTNLSKSESIPHFPTVSVDLIGSDGNAFAVLGRTAKALRRAGVNKADIEAFKVEAMSGDYNNLLATAMRWVEVN